MQLESFQYLLKHFLWSCKKLELVRYDLAIDVPTKKENVRFLNLKKHKYELVKSQGATTEYCGQRSSNFFTKIYDKTFESKLDYELTRVEITLEREVIDTKQFPTISIYDGSIDDELNFENFNSDELVLIDLLRNSDAQAYYLTNLKPHTRKKIEPYLGDKVLDYNLNILKDIRNDLISLEKHI